MIHHLAERIEYAKDELAWLEAGAKEGEEPWRGLDVINNTREGEVWAPCVCAPAWHPANLYRRRPKMIHAIDAKGVRYEWPEPLREAPKINTRFFRVEVHYNTVSNTPWIGSASDACWLESGLCQATKEGAQMQLAAIRAVCRGGEA